MFLTLTMIVLGFPIDKSGDYEDPDLGKQAGQDLHCSRFNYIVFAVLDAAMKWFRCSDTVLTLIYAPCKNCVHELHYYYFHMACHIFVYMLFYVTI